MLKPEKTPGDTSWFVKDRFGLFIHWGIYALPARHEWVKNREEIPDEEYEKYFRYFDPDLYDPALWAKAAAGAGMKYFVVTTKHHDGFCLWDSALTDYKATNTPYGKDLIAPMVTAFRGENMRVGFYHSLIDWHHPEFPVDMLHPMRNHGDAAQWNKTRDVSKYAAYLHGQVEELLSNYGQIDVMWFDFSYSQAKWARDERYRGKGKADWQSEKLIEIVRGCQPNIILNDRTEIPQDIKTPEQFQPQGWVKVDGKPVVWEACHTFSGSWGYHRDEMTWKSPKQLIGLLVNSVSCGGNLLMNVGPTGRGEFDERALSALEVYGVWMRRHSRSIYGCTMSEFDAPSGCRYTQNGKRLYCHVFDWPFRHLHLPELSGKVEYAQLLNDASEVKFKDAGSMEFHGMDVGQKRGNLVLELPVVKPNVTVPVIEIFLK
jgi:alpha-L-fucosidase